MEIKSAGKTFNWKFAGNIKNYAEQIRGFVPNQYTVLGTDGFGRSDTRAELRHYFEVDRYHIAYAGLKALHDQGKLSLEKLTAAMKALKINAKKLEPFTH